MATSLSKGRKLAKAIKVPESQGIVIDKAISDNYSATDTSIDVTAANTFSFTASSDTTFTIDNTRPSGDVNSFILELTNGGAYTITWWSGLTWNGGTAPTLTESGIDVLAFYTYDGGTTWRGLVIAQDIKAAA